MSAPMKNAMFVALLGLMTGAVLLMVGDIKARVDMIPTNKLTIDQLQKSSDDHEARIRVLEHRP